jgi:hypothetical protein
MSDEQGAFVWEVPKRAVSKKESRSRQIVDVVALKKLAARNFDARPKEAR